MGVKSDSEGNHRNDEAELRAECHRNHPSTCRANVLNIELSLRLRDVCINLSVDSDWARCTAFSLTRRWWWRLIPLESGWWLEHSLHSTILWAAPLSTQSFTRWSDLPPIPLCPADYRCGCSDHTWIYCVELFTNQCPPLTPSLVGLLYLHVYICYNGI